MREWKWLFMNCKNIQAQFLLQQFLKLWQDGTYASWCLEMRLKNDNNSAGKKSAFNTVQSSCSIFVNYRSLLLNLLHMFSLIPSSTKCTKGQQQLVTEHGTLFIIWRVNEIHTLQNEQKNAHMQSTGQAPHPSVRISSSSFQPKYFTYGH